MTDIVPFIDLKRLSASLLSDFSKVSEEILSTGNFIEGNHIEKLENQLIKKSGCSFCDTCSNGTDALILALQACDVKPGDIIPLSNLTFWATYEAIISVGAIPLLIDISGDDLQMNFDNFCEAFKIYRFKTAILTHIYGWASIHINNFRKFSLDNSISLIEDGAQSFGSKVKSVNSDSSVSIYQDSFISTLSFYPTKVLGGIADGGAVLSNSEKISSSIKSLRNHGRSKTPYVFDRVGSNARISSINAAYINIVLDRIDNLLLERRATFNLFARELEKHVPIIEIKEPPKDQEHNGYLNVIVCNQIDPIFILDQMKLKGIFCGRIYPKTIIEQLPAQKSLKIGNLNNSINFTKKVINLPLFHSMTSNERNKVVNAFHGLIKTSS